MLGYGRLPFVGGGLRPCFKRRSSQVRTDHPKAGTPSFCLFSLYFEELFLAPPSSVVCVDERPRCLALSARRPRRRRRAAVLQRNGQAMKMAFIDVDAALFCFLFISRSPFLTPFSTVCLRRRTPSAGDYSVFSIWASSLLKARAPRWERPARPRRRLSLAVFRRSRRPLPAALAPLLRRRLSGRIQRPPLRRTKLCPAPKHRRGSRLFRRLVSAARRAVVDRRLSWCPLGLSCRVRAKTVLSLAAEGFLRDGCWRRLSPPTGSAAALIVAILVSPSTVAASLGPAFFLVAGRRAAGP